MEGRTGEREGGGSWARAVAAARPRIRKTQASRSAGAKVTESDLWLLKEAGRARRNCRVKKMLRDIRGRQSRNAVHAFG